MAAETVTNTEAAGPLYPDVLTLWDKPELHLRALTIADADEMYNVTQANQSHLEEFQPLRMGDMTPFRIGAMINLRRLLMDRGSMLSYSMIKDEEIVGEVVLRELKSDAKIPKLTYWVSREERGNGYAYSCSRRLVQLAFEEMDVTKVMLKIDPRNSRSVSVASKLEAHLTGDVETIPSEDDQSLTTYQLWEIDKQ